MLRGVSRINISKDIHIGAMTSLTNPNFPEKKSRDFGFGTDVKLPLVMEGSIMIKLLSKWNKGYEDFTQCSPLG
ncbi:hypothetical protein C5167_001667 [Papaver somniferum]|uniref:Uncharacterized protein n=1 Tax=Papaver somniferum TaxID=3469 RepID=A0A4Y7KVW3_PAPSO|nr:hypothetical protein C5167_001667 [Papaver somniferum]